MIDIVERLRKTSAGGLDEYGVHCEIEAEAADEIERLTKERDFARDAVVQKCRQYDADMETMRLSLNREIDERDRLRASSK